MGKFNRHGHSFMGFIETVTVGQTSYQILRISSFCNWERAQNPLININVLTFLVKKGTVKLSGMYIFWEYYAKKKKLWVKYHPWIWKSLFTWKSAILKLSAVHKIAPVLIGNKINRWDGKVKLLQILSATYTVVVLVDYGVMVQKETENPFVWEFLFYR